MGNRLTYIAGLALTTLAHLALIPILALYGIAVCPVLSEHGFGLGCVYNGSFVIYVIVANTLSTFALAAYYSGQFFKNGGATALRNFRLVAFGVYAFAFSMGMFGLLRYFFFLHVPLPTIDRMTAALFYAGTLLGILHIQILDWLALVWVRAQPTRPQDPAGSKSNRTLQTSWLFGAFWKHLPTAGALAIAGTFVFRMFREILEESTIQSTDLLDELKDSSNSLALLAGWWALIRFIAFLRERRLLKDVNDHLLALGRLDANHFSLTESTGFWESIFHGLNRTTDLIAQRSRLIQGFSSYVAKTVVDQVLTQSDGKPLGELQPLTILSSDLRDFTRTANGLGAAQVVQSLNIYFADMIEVLVQAGIVLDKFIGDGILAYVDPNEGASAKARETGVRAAIAMHHQLVQTNKKLKEASLPPLKLGVALHAGNVVLGNIGTPERMQYTIIGDPVNIACRLESFCKTLEVGLVVSQEIWTSLPAELQALFTHFGEHEVRGISGAIRLYGVAFENGQALSPATQTRAA